MKTLRTVLATFGITTLLSFGISRLKGTARPDFHRWLLV